MKYYFKCIFYLVVLINFNYSLAATNKDFFFVAVRQDNPRELVEVLRRGVDPNEPNRDGQFGLILALREGSLKVLDVLLDWPGIRAEVRNVVDESPLMLASLKGYASVCERLIALDADINKPGWTALHYAASGGHPNIVRLLLEHDAYIDAASPNGTTPLMMAAMYGNAVSVKILLEAGADPTLRNEADLSALDFAHQAGMADSAMVIEAFLRAQGHAVPQ